MGAMKETDRDLFREKYEDLKYMESKVSNRETFGDDVEEITAETKTDLDELIRQTVSNGVCTFLCHIFPPLLSNVKIFSVIFRCQTESGLWFGCK